MMTGTVGELRDVSPQSCWRVGRGESGLTSRCSPGRVVCCVLGELRDVSPQSCWRVGRGESGLMSRCSPGRVVCVCWRAARRESAIVLALRAW